MIQNLIEEVQQKFSVLPSHRFVEKLLSSQPSINAQDIFRIILHSNLSDVVEASSLPIGIASQLSSTIPSNLVLQISTSRDATQPLRPSADATADEIDLYGSGQKNSPKRLLKLVLTDGLNNIGAFELCTLQTFHSIPIPGEKVLIKAGAEVKNGSIILNDDHVVLLGGEVLELKKAFLDHHHRVASAALSGYQTSIGIEGAPKFQPLSLGLITGNGLQRSTGQENKGKTGEWSTCVPHSEECHSPNLCKTNYKEEHERRRGNSRGRTSAPSHYRGRGRGEAKKSMLNRSSDSADLNAGVPNETFTPGWKQQNITSRRGSFAPRRYAGNERGRGSAGGWYRENCYVDPASEKMV